MESIEAKIKAFLNGEVKDDPEKEFLNIDYSLDQQNYELSKWRWYFLYFVITICLFTKVLEASNPKVRSSLSQRLVPA